MTVGQLVGAVVEVFGLLLTAKVKVQSQDCICGIYVEQSGTSAFFGFPYALFFCSR